MHGALSSGENSWTWGVVAHNFDIGYENVSVRQAWNRVR
jgi:hypothetical protein